MRQKKNTYHGMEGTLRGLLQKWVSQGGWGTQINKEKITSVITFFVSPIVIGYKVGEQGPNNDLQVGLILKFFH